MKKTLLFLLISIHFPAQSSCSANIGQQEFDEALSQRLVSAHVRTLVRRKKAQTDSEQIARIDTELEQARRCLDRLYNDPWFSTPNSPDVLRWRSARKAQSSNELEWEQDLSWLTQFLTHGNGSA
jgi:hypothetical protein